MSKKQSTNRDGSEAKPAKKGRIITTWPLSKLKPHPKQADLFSDLSPAKFRSLKQDMDSNGLQHPIDVLPDGTILGGHQRTLAAQALGWTEIRVRIRHDLAAKGAEAIEEFVINDNLQRRQLDPIEMARCILRLMEIERERRKRDPAGAQGEVREAVGEQLEMSGRQVDRYLRVLETPKEVQDAVVAGQLTLMWAARVAGLEPEQQHEIAGRIASALADSAHRDESQSETAHAKQVRSSLQQIVREFVNTGDGRRKAADDAMATFVRALGKGLKDLNGHAKGKRGDAWKKHLPTLKSAEQMIGKLIKQIDSQ